MSKTLFLHVGAGKTGTSAIQTAIKQNRDYLLKRGLFVPEIGAKLSESYLAHHSLSGVARFKTGDWKEQWHSIAGLPHETVLVTSELFHSLISRESGRNIFEFVLREFRDWNVRIIFYIRRQDLWVQSAYEEWLKTGHLRDGRTLNKFAASYSVTLVDQIRCFASIFGENSLIVRPYEFEQLVKGDAVSDFFSIFGIDIDEDFSRLEAPVNRSLPPWVLETKRIYNSICDSPEEARKLNGPIFEFEGRFGSDGFSSDLQRAVLLEPEVRQRILSRNLMEGYAWVSQQLCKRKDSELFVRQKPEIVDKDRAEETKDYIKRQRMRFYAYLYKLGWMAK